MKKGGASLDLGIAEAKVGKNSGVRVGTKKHNIQANVGVDGINANALNLASASLDKKGLKGHIGHKKLLKAKASLGRKGLKGSIGNKKILNADASANLSGIDIGADHMLGRTGVRLGSKSKKGKKSKKGEKSKRALKVGPLEARVTGGGTKKR